jgi:phosphomannomutase
MGIVFISAKSRLNGLALSFMPRHGKGQIMVRKYFGTDGIRGLANGDKLTPELAMKIGMAAGKKFVRGEHRNRVVIGKDTRRSGYMIETALTAGVGMGPSR